MSTAKTKTWSKDQVKEKFGFDFDEAFESYVEVNFEEHDGSTVRALCGVVAETGSVICLGELTQS